MCIQVYQMHKGLLPKTGTKGRKKPIYSLSRGLLILANCYLKQDILQ